MTPTPDAIALGAIRALAAVTAGGVAKTAQQMRADLTAIQTLVAAVLASPAPPAPALPPVQPPASQPPVPPAPTPQPPQPPSSGALAFSEFVGYRTQAALDAALPKLTGAAGTARTHLIKLDTAVTYRGRPTLRFDQPAGSNVTPMLWPRLPVPLSDVWLRVVLRFSPGWTTAGTARVANSYKLMALGFPGGRTPVGAALNGRAGVQLTNTTQYVLGGGYTPGVPAREAKLDFVTDEWTSGAFMDYRMHYVVTSSRSAVVRHWRSLDGEWAVPRLVGRVDLAAATAWATMPKVSFVCCGLNANQTRVAAQSIWVAAIEVVAGGDPWGLG